MGASRKLQGEIDRVLKKVQEGVDVFDSIWNKVYETGSANLKEKFEADLKKEIKKLQRYRDQIKTWIQSSEIKDKKISASYEQALVDARKVIEREMERFKICEKETKTKAFSKEGLGQQPKTDPKEKAKAEARDWLNNVVSELESQIDSFEAELEGIHVKKGKSRPPRLTHLETSISRHKAHIMKLELILRLLDNDELSPEEVNDVKDFLDDYVERNQDNFDEFGEVDDLYSSLPLDKVELEDLVTMGPLVKAAPSLSLKPSLGASTVPASVSHKPSASQEQSEEKASLSNSSDVALKTPLKSNPSVSAPARSQATSLLVNIVPAHNTSGITNNTSNNISNSSSVQSILETSLSPLIPISLSSTKVGDVIISPSHVSSPSIVDGGTQKGIGRGVQPTQLATVGSSTTGIVAPSSIGALAETDTAKRNIIGLEARLGNSGTGLSLVSTISNRIMQLQDAKCNDRTSLIGSNTSETPGLGGRVFSPASTPWRAGNPFQNQNETGHFLGRPQIVPDHKEKFLHRFEQVQQHGPSAFGMPSLTAGNNKQQFPMQQQNLALPQLQGFNSGSAGPQQNESSMYLQSSHQLMKSDTDQGHLKNEEQQQQIISDISLRKCGLTNISDEDDFRASHDITAGVSSPGPDPSQVARPADVSPHQSSISQSSSSFGVARSQGFADVGAIGESINRTAAHSGVIQEQAFNLQMLEAAYHKIPRPEDSERPKHSAPKRAVSTPPSYPQVQAPIISNPLFWERLSCNSYGYDTLFFAFYFQQNSYQQYLAARELKKQSWRFHRKHNTWFQRHLEPKIVTDEYEHGSYIYFDHILDGQDGWGQRIRTEFAFEYQYLEDELV